MTAVPVISYHRLRPDSPCRRCIIDPGTYLGYYWPSIIDGLLQHLLIVFLSIPFSILVSVPIGIAISPHPRLKHIVLTITSFLMTIPSLALFGLMVVVLGPLGLGIGKAPAVIAIIIYSLLPIIRNTVLALAQVPSKTIEAARGIGYTKAQTILRIMLPLSIPVIMAGVRNSVVLGIGVACYASLVGSGGLGYFIFSGIGRANFYMICTGAILVSALAIGANYVLLRLEDLLTPRGLKAGKKAK